VQFSRIQLSQGCFTLLQRRNQIDQLYKPQLSIQFGIGKPFPTRISPTLVTMRPQSPDNPAIKLVEQLSDMGFAIVIAPSAKEANGKLSIYRLAAFRTRGE